MWLKIFVPNFVAIPIDELAEKDKECVFSLLDAYLAKSKLQAFLK